MKKYFWVIIMVLVSSQALMLSSCNSSRKVPYFKDVTDTLRTSALIPERVFTDVLIEPYDVLQISIQTIDAKATEVFSQFGKTLVDNAQPGYQVDKEGNIEMPIFGKIHLQGLTLLEARNMIREMASKYYKDPAVNMRFLNFYITVLGDVSRPGRLNIINERVSIIDAIGMIGDLPLTAQKDNVILIREEDGKKLFVRLDLNTSKIFQSPYYYLKSGDILYFLPSKAKARVATADVSRDRYITYVTAFISIFLTVYTLAKAK